MELWTVDSYKKGATGPKIRKRKRLTLTCTSCRQRKIKCDQGRPCSSCIKRNFPSDMCIYNDPPFAAGRNSNSPGSHEDVSPETVKLLKDEIQTLKGQLADVHQKSSNGLINIESRSITNSVRAEPKLKLFGHLYTKKDKTVHFGPTSWRTLIDKEENHDNLINASKEYIKNLKKKWKFENDINKMSSDDYKAVNVESPITLLENLANYLPNYELVSTYVKRYVKGYWNKRTPIIDDDEFLTSFDELFCQLSDGSCHIRVHNKTIDYAKIALILIVIKHSVNTVNGSSLNVQPYDFNDRLLLYTNKLLELSRYIVKPSMPALQALILLRQFKMVNPIDGDGGDGNKGSLQFKTAINMAIIMGLHKDIDDLYHEYSENTRVTLKNIWKHLLFQDAVLSFHMGIPLSIDEKFVNPLGLLRDDLYGVLGLCLREAVDCLSANECYQSDLLRIVEKMVTFNDGELLKLSSVLRNMSGVELLSNESCLIDIELKIFAIYVLHVLFDVLYHGTENNNPDKQRFYNGAMKYGTLTISHFIEVMVQFNKICAEYADTSGIFILVEMCQSIVGVSKIIFLKIYTCIYTSELVRLIDANVNSQPNLKEVFNLNITDIENYNIDDPTNMLNSSFRSPSFLHGLMTLSCRYLLKLKNNSFGTVFSMNFCLFVVLALFKYFEKLIDQRFSRQKQAIEYAKEKTLLIYNNVQDQSSGPLPTMTLNSTDTGSNSTHRPGENWPGPTMLPPISNKLPEGLYQPTKIPFKELETSVSLSPPNLSTFSSDQPQSTVTADKFDDMVEKILYSKDLDFFDLHYDQNFHYNHAGDFLSGTGMFYDNETSLNGQQQDRFR